VDPYALNVPGGESLMGFFERCALAIDRLVARHPAELVVLVVHGASSSRPSRSTRESAVRCGFARASSSAQ